MHISDPAPLTPDDIRKIVIGVLAAMLLAALDQSIVAPAIPDIRAALNDDVYYPWLVSGYFLTATAVTPLYGKLSDIYGRRPVLFAAIAIFVLGSIICALAPNMGVIIFGRCVQGLGGGGLIALAQTVIGDIVPPRERAGYVAYITTVWAVASIAGPILGGSLAKYAHWSFIFWINVPVAAMALWLTNSSLKKLPPNRRDHSLDFLGAALIIGATVLLQLALTWAGNRFAWASVQIASLFGGSFVLAALFAWRLAKAAEPLIPLQVIRNPVVAAATAALFFAMGAYVALVTYLPLYFHGAFGLDAGQSGLAMVVVLVTTVVGANTTGRYMPRVVHYRRFALAGCALSAVSTMLFAFRVSHAGLSEALTFMAIAGLGIGTVFPITTVAVQNAVDPRDLGTATSAAAFLRSLGSTVGVAIVGAVLLGHGVGLGSPENASLATTETLQGFTSAVGAASAALWISLGLILAMKELPLRGKSATLN